MGKHTPERRAARLRALADRIEAYRGDDYGIGDPLDDIEPGELAYLLRELAGYLSDEPLTITPRPGNIGEQTCPWGKRGTVDCALYAPTDCPGDRCGSPRPVESEEGRTP